MFTPFVFNREDLFRLRGPVGPVAVNNTDDVAKVETALDGLGFFAMNRRQCPSGEFHSELGEGLRKFQRANRLKEDAKVNPGGPTIRKLAQEIAEAPGPGNVDDSAPTGKPSGIKDIKTDPQGVQDVLDLLRSYVEGLPERLRNIKLPSGPAGGMGRPGGQAGRFNRKTHRIDDIFE